MPVNQLAHTGYGSAAIILDEQGIATLGTLDNPGPGHPAYMVRIKVSQQLTHEAGSAVVLPAFSGDHRVRRADGTEGRVQGIGLLLRIGIGMHVIHYFSSFYGKFRNLAKNKTPFNTDRKATSELPSPP